MVVKCQTPRDGIKDAHPDVLAHPGFAPRGQVRSEFRKMASDDPRDVVLSLSAGAAEHLAHLRPGIGLHGYSFPFGKRLESVQHSLDPG